MPKRHSDWEVLRDLPNLRTGLGTHFLYAFEFGDGRVKIGVSMSPRERAAAVARAIKARLTRVHFVPCTCRAQRRIAERSALESAGRIGNRSPLSAELFHDIRFAEAANLVSQMARRAHWPQLIGAEGAPDPVGEPAKAGAA